HRRAHRCGSARRERRACSGTARPPLPRAARSTVTAPRSAIVTGAGTGIGRAVARALLADGFGVTFTGRRRDPLVEASSPDGSPHPQALVVPADVTVPDDVERLVAAHVERFGRLDVLFNNAGVPGPAADVGELTPDDWQQ